MRPTNPLRLALTLSVLCACRVHAQHDHHTTSCEGEACAKKAVFTTTSINPVIKPPPGDIVTPPNDGTTAPPPGDDVQAQPTLDEKQLKEERRRLNKLFPTMKPVIEKTLEKTAAGAVGPTQIKEFETYLAAREKLNDYIEPFLPRGMTPEKLTAMRPEDPKKDQVMSTLRSKLRLTPGAFQDFRALAEKADTTMSATLHSPNSGEFGLVIMNNDLISHALYEIKPRPRPNPGNDADDDWVSQRPNRPEPLINRGQASMLAGDYKAATNDLSKAVALSPDNVRALTLLGAAERELGNYEAAARHAAKALSIDPNDKGAQNVYALSAGRGGKAGGEISDKGAAAFAAATPAAAAPSASMNLPAMKTPAISGAREAARQFALGDYGAAAKDAQLELEKNPADQLAAFYLAAARMKLGDNAGALQAADAALALDPKSAALHVARAQALNRLGRYRDALAAASLAGGLNPRDASALVASAEAHAGLGDRAAALEALKRAAALDSRFSRLYEDARAMGPEDDLLTLFQKDGSRTGKGGSAAHLTGALARLVGKENVTTVLGAAAAGLLVAVIGAFALKRRENV